MMNSGSETREIHYFLTVKCCCVVNCAEQHSSIVINLLQATQNRELAQLLKLDHLIEKLGAFCRTHMFIAVYVVVRHWLKT